MGTADRVGGAGSCQRLGMGTQPALPGPAWTTTLRMPSFILCHQQVCAYLPCQIDLAVAFCTCPDTHAPPDKHCHDQPRRDNTLCKVLPTTYWAFDVLDPSHLVDSRFLGSTGLMLLHVLTLVYVSTTIVVDVVVGALEQHPSAQHGAASAAMCSRPLLYQTFVSPNFGRYPAMPRPTHLKCQLHLVSLTPTPLPPRSDKPLRRPREEDRRERR